MTTTDCASSPSAAPATPVRQLRLVIAAEDYEPRETPWRFEELD